jgi:phosphatidylserine decarboxylase
MTLLITLILVLVLFLMMFYRQPQLNVQSSNHSIVFAPASGKIQQIAKQPDGSIHIAIFLSPLDQHYQVAPICGTVVSQIYDQNGRFELAYELTKAHDNEKMITTIDTKYGLMTVTQIAGYLVRRISSYVKQGQSLTSGELIGRIAFGSRVDIQIPNARYFQLTVQEGQKVDAGWTQLGTYQITQ